MLDRLAACFDDHRDPERIEHSVAELVKQRVYAIALGYEDVNDHDQLRNDSVLALLAGKSTLNRLERTTDGVDSHNKISCAFEHIDELLLATFIEAHEEAPKQVILDLNVTDSPLHGEQEGRFFHGYYRCYCYLPLYIFAGPPLLCARQRTSDTGASGWRCTRASIGGEVSRRSRRTGRDRTASTGRGRRNGCSNGRARRGRRSRRW